MKLENKNVYIFGGSQGIGLETAKALAGRGAHVTIFARTKELLKSALAEVSDSSRSEIQRFTWRAVDVSVSAEVTSVITEVVADFGAPDILINCAGRARPHHFKDITYEMFDETIRVNLYGIWNTVSAALPHMKQRGGHIVNTSSLVGLLGIFGYADYAASKAAIIGFSEVIRSELKRYNIGVSVLCPPDVDTPGNVAENRTKPRETMAVSGNAKLMTPQDVAQALIKGMEKNKFIIIPKLDGRIIYLVKRLFPCLVEFVIDRIVKKAQR